MNGQRIPLEDFKKNFKKTYHVVENFGYCPEQFFGIVRYKNLQLEQVPSFKKDNEEEETKEIQDQEEV